MSKLDRELVKDESMWRMWREEGVTESTVLEVDVAFYATSEDAAQQIAGCLQQWDLSKIEIQTKRTLWFFKGWEITGVEKGTWSLEKLQDRSRRYERLAEIWSARYEGCGAWMPDKQAT